MLAKVSFLYPHEPINIREALSELLLNDIIMELPDWEWIPAPGHSPGQIALFRDTDRLLISADAFITVEQDSFYKVLIQKTEVCGPPVYLTTDWDAANNSVKHLSALQPQTVISGHGTAMQGEELRIRLQYLIADWNEDAVPSHGKWVEEEKE